MKQLLTILILLLTLNTVHAQTVNEKALDRRYTSGIFNGDNAHILVPMADPAATPAFNVLQYLQGRVPGLIIYNSNSFMPHIVYRGGYPTFFLDEIRVDAQTIMNIPMQDVAIIKVFRPPFIGSFFGGGGGVAVYTKRGDEDF